MDNRILKLGLLLAGGLTAALAFPRASDLFDVDVRQLVGIWDQEHVSPQDPYSLKHAELKRRLEAVQREFPDLIQMEVAGKSVEGREIFLLRLGTGPGRVLIWSQMHGDEPTGTSAILDLFQFFGRHRQEPWVSDILQKVTLICIPMLNPDGAERNQRRNAQGIDINRDARMLQTPEGRLLKDVRDRFKPFLGFNLHNQNATTTVGDTGRVATIALLAVATDLPPGAVVPEGATQTSGPLAKQVTAVLYEALSPFVYGHISRYDEVFNPRAFGDNLTFWGTPVVLIECGGLPTGEPENLAVKLNFASLLATLNSIASGRIQNANPAVFDALKVNNSGSPIYDVLLRNAWTFTGTGVPLFRADIGIRFDQRARQMGDSTITEIGDLGVFSAHETIDCTRAMVTPGLIAWDPKWSAIGGKQQDLEYLRKGISTVVETVSWDELMQNEPGLQRRSSESRGINWGFLVFGQPPSTDTLPVRLMDWFASGSRAWVVENRAQVPQSMRRVPAWFGVDLIDREPAEGLAIPANLKGDPATVLPRWTAEAARQLHISRRGVISQGAVADLVIWDIPSDGVPSEIADCKPARVILNGKVVTLDGTGAPPRGKFLSR